MFLLKCDLWTFANLVYQQPKNPSVLKPIKNTLGCAVDFFFFTVGMDLPEISVTSYNAKCFFSQTMIFDLSQLIWDTYLIFWM